MTGDSYRDVNRVKVYRTAPFTHTQCYPGKEKRPLVELPFASHRQDRPTRACIHAIVTGARLPRTVENQVQEQPSQRTLGNTSNSKVRAQGLYTLPSMEKQLPKTIQQRCSENKSYFLLRHSNPAEISTHKWVCPRTDQGDVTSGKSHVYPPRLRASVIF